MSEGLPQGVKGAGADIAEDHADRAKCQGGEPAPATGRRLGVRQFAIARRRDCNDGFGRKEGVQVTVSGTGRSQGRGVNFIAVGARGTP
jgi:hypothetical protein